MDLSSSITIREIPRIGADARAQITLDDLKPHFGKKLVDAARSLGVSRSTLKRISRRHGINGWHLRERENANHHIHSGGTSTLGVYSDARAQISLDVLQQYSGVNLIDTAKCLGVSRSTLKRVCRTHGINGWPSQERENANHHIHSSDPGLPAGAVQIVDEEAVQESQGGNPSIVNALSENEAAIPTMI
ncbi:hypothetical protein ACH5RR_038287 [Cinchona calisaya]|uniref:RWP-RK domain-containing protein n=1 Tax=Cinchona calisaya TaxID=153742 RepID=A0ABD2XYA3_9GENT